MSVTVVARPLADHEWPGQLRTERAYSPFRALWTSTEELLLREVGALSGTEIVLQLAVDERDLRQDGRIRANAQPSRHPGVIVSFTARPGPLRYSCDTYRGFHRNPGWQANVRAIALSLEALRAVDRHGVGQGDEQYRGYQALPPGGVPLGAADTSTMTLEEAWSVLLEAAGEAFGELVAVHGQPSHWGVGMADVRLVYRAAAHRHHPDAGGDPDRWLVIDRAKRVLDEHGASS